jgi:hypothetical protein
VDTELLVKAVTATVAGFGAVLALLHFLTTRSSHRYQNSKTEMELLSQGIAAYEAEPEYKKFLTDVRKERISFLVFGIPIPNADLERAMTYYRKAEGKVTTGDIAKAWQYRDVRTEQLSFQLRGSFKTQYILANVYLVFCIAAAGIGVLTLQSAVYSQGILLVGVSVLAVVVTIWITQGLFTAARLGKLEKERPMVSNDA